jgi:hypothetical protein
MLLPIKQFNYIFIISIFFIYTSCSQRVTTDSSFCQKLYYSPGHSDSTYSLSKGEIEKIKILVSHMDLGKLKKNYTVKKTDQPTSTIKFYINNTTIITKDYGLKGDYPLQELYRIAYKF